MKKYLMMLWAILLLVPLAAGCKTAQKPIDSSDSALSAAEQSFLNNHVYFDFDRYNIRPDAAQICQDKAAFLSEFANVRVEVQGHTDERGTEVYNMALGDRRARSTFNYMTELGIDSSRMNTVSYGEERPIDPAQNEAAWSKNRRAQFVITAK